MRTTTCYLVPLLVSAAAYISCAENKCLGVVCETDSACFEKKGVCDTNTGGCVYTPKKPGVVCRAAVDLCDIAEVCDGVSGGCPVNGFAPAGEVCRPADGLCDQAEVCSGSSGYCPNDITAVQGTLCRAARAPCDAAEVCDGSSRDCPADGLANSGVECRPASGLCDPAEHCDGASEACPPDARSVAGTTCRPAAGDCDVAESCDGASALCPLDSLLPVGTECRPSAGQCDQAEQCQGQAACPGDQFAPAVVVCRSAAGVCDQEETCSGSGAACPEDQLRDDNTVCREARDLCDAAEYCSGQAACPDDEIHSEGTICRAATGPCDLAEHCDGSGESCPGDQMAEAGTECRPAGGPCDLAEVCTGSEATCPQDLKAEATEICRPKDGPCDIAEHCTGLANGCPADRFAGGDQICRPVQGTCDLPESCSGSTGACPQDHKRSAGWLCRAAVDTCDVGETCDGDSDDCPENDFASSQTLCGDAHCTDNVAHSIRRCDGQGACAPASTAPCEPYLCGSDSCADTCLDKTDCQRGYFCIDGNCLPRDAYITYLSGGDIGGTGIDQTITATGDQAIAVTQGRRLFVYLRGQGSSWTVSHVDDLANVPQIEADAAGALHLAYEEQGTGRIKYATNSGGAWQRAVVSSGAEPSLAVGPDGRPHIAFSEAIGFGAINRLAILEEGEWSVQPISSGGSMGCYCSHDPTSSCSCGKEPGRAYLRVSPSGDPVVLFPRYGTYQGIELATLQGDAWSFENIEAFGFIEGATSIAIGADGQPRLGYTMLGDVLRLKARAQDSWSQHDLTLRATGRADLLVDGDGHAHLCIYGDQLLYASDRQGSWLTETVDSEVPDALYCALAETPGGEIHIAYHQASSGDLKLATGQLGSWVTSTVAHGAIFGGVTALDLDADGGLHLAAARRSQSGTGSYKDYHLAYLAAQDGVVTETVLSQMDHVFPQCRLVVDSEDNPHMLYYHEGPVDDGLVYVGRVGGSWQRESITGVAGVGRVFDLAVTQQDTVYILYDGVAEFTSLAGTAFNWNAEIIDTVDVSFLAAAGSDLVTHTLYVTTTLNHASNNGGDWHRVVVNPTHTSLVPVDIAVSGSVAHAVFHNPSQGTWYGNNEGGAWSIEPIDAPVRLDPILRRGITLEILLDAAGQPHVIVENREEQLVDAWRTAEGWRGQILDQDWRGIEGPAASLGPDGKIHISYIAEGAVFLLVVP